MQQKYFLLIVLFTLSFISLLIVNSSLISARVSCDNCEVSKECTCEVTDCAKGLLRIYTSSNCTDMPTARLVFSDGTVGWNSSQAGTYYAKAFCDSGETSLCRSINVSAVGTIATTTTIAALITTTTTAAPITTTTTTTLADCPIDICCIDEIGYKNKFCDVGMTCVNNKCVNLEPNVGFVVSYSVIEIIAVVVVIVVFAFYFFSGRFFGKGKSDAFETLKKKWKKR